MGRNLSPQRHQWLVAYWRRQILALQWGVAGLGVDLTQLAALIEGEIRPINPGQRPRLKAALGELRKALAGPPDISQADLDGWIDRYLVARSDRLLISEARRKAVLVWLRDGERRQAHTRQGLRSARIEMPEGSWQKLGQVRDQLGTATLGQTFERVIDAYVAAERTTGGKKHKPRTPQGKDIQADLLGPLLLRIPGGQSD